ncbi:hypothetical protein G3I31_21455 [Streptomyces sp. SID9913]|uniref:hypothetical protein n=1 Tax=Streptomyces sp. SID9913 TaxID=2706117 RepID=UPI0013DA444D|nr:hypothetical protein [Streptomyces sp. SID9913]NED20621.1 hypothetical protein [Streptomyces sp. SID9913]
MSSPAEVRSGHTPHRVATAADVNTRWVKEAIKEGLVDGTALEGEDVIVVRSYAFLDRVVWPGERRDPKDSRQTALWQSLALNTVRDALTSPEANPDTVVWASPEGAIATHTPQDAAALAARTSGRTMVKLPVGSWAAALPHPFEIRYASRDYDENARIVARAAGTPLSLVHRLAAADLADLRCLGVHDVVLLKAAASLDGVAWPSSAVASVSALAFPAWVSDALASVRTALQSPSCSERTNVWATPSGARITHTPGEAAQWLIDSLSDQPVVKLPVGYWLARTPDPLAELSSQTQRIGD